MALRHKLVLYFMCMHYFYFPISFITYVNILLLVAFTSIIKGDLLQNKKENISNQRETLSFPFL